MLSNIPQGFSRYLLWIITGVVLACVSVFLMGYLAFTGIYLDDFYDLSVLIDLFHQRYQAPDAWHAFIQTESIVFLISFSAVAYHVFEHIRPAHKVLGNAHFSNGFEIQRAGFFRQEDQSIIIGKKYGAPLFANGFEHVLVFAPTGSGKTRSIGIPNLFHYPYSVVCNDVKLTMFKTTSGYREQVLGHKCYCWAPASNTRETHRYNPLSLISTDPFQRITLILNFIATGTLI